MFAHKDSQTSDLLDDSEGPFAGIEEVDETSQDVLWFPPGPIVQDPMIRRLGHGQKPAGPPIRTTVGRRSGQPCSYPGL